MARDRDRRAGFPETHLSMVAGAQSDDPDVRARALHHIAVAYYGAVYMHVRLKWSKTPSDAEDAVQAFFEHATLRDLFGQYDASRGRFRTFLRVCVDSVVGIERRAERRLKRGGAATAIAFDAAAVEAEIARMTPEVDVDEAFTREFRRGLVARSVQSLERVLAESGKRVYFDVFQSFDLHDGDAPRPTYGAIAEALGIKSTDVTNHLSFARRTLRRLLAEELREVAASDEEYDEEARALGIA